MNKLGVSKKACILFMFCVVTAIGTPAQTTTIAPTVTFTTLHSFDLTDGRFPRGALVQATNGVLYGTTSDGGANGGGTIFSITTGGNLATVYNFCLQSHCADGSTPNAGLIQVTNGKFYGAAAFGGPNQDAGTIFNVTPKGVLTTLYSFCSQSNCTDGVEPNGKLVEGTNGKFYGTTAYGGANTSCVNGCGTVFSITGAGQLESLHSFDGTDGNVPLAGLVEGVNGNFFGTTYFGGAQGDGTVFKITASGALTTLYNFCPQNGCPDGANPSGLIQGTNGKFYGTTMAGGTELNGTVFSINSSGKLTILHSFGNTEGQNPAGGLIPGNDGNFYGTTYYGGTNRNGTIFEITPNGTLTTLYNFCSQTNCTDGANPSAVLAQDTDGTFYGSTELGGANGEGTVFGVSAGLGPFVETNPVSAKVGAPVTILGTGLTHASSVTFNGTAATFTVVSGSDITTTVPTGATTGTVKVVTPKGTLKSDVPFRVLP